MDIKLYQELPVISGDSYAVLHGPSWGRYEHDPFHHEYCGNGGSTIMESAALLIFYYWHVKQPLRVVFICGLNDFMEGRSNEQIISSYQAVKMIIEEFDEKNGMEYGKRKF